MSQLHNAMWLLDGFELQAIALPGQQKQNFHYLHGKDCWHLNVMVLLTLLFDDIVGATSWSTCDAFSCCTFCRFCRFLQQKMHGKQYAG